MPATYGAKTCHFFFFKKETKNVYVNDVAAEMSLRNRSHSTSCCHDRTKNTSVVLLQTRLPFPSFITYVIGFSDLVCRVTWPMLYTHARAHARTHSRTHARTLTHAHTHVPPSPFRLSLFDGSLAPNRDAVIAPFRRIVGNQ